ncbi:radical S-adenosyl methionine domain-containing protein 1, mitochondrial-like isoform X2 [Eriocheir sinensis]|uniref:radical S-adenosyl methionine domain-containing protein 1, mitochondrial-like isoform X2 n=1 Tax=Eriocheir sinensis TaxID=95602 RepID=UPI0021C837F6|nr:radical S-adenosyl methionine domain-containing protein 1, mitochondrial-like isoform X2 [Eriocheir sinensis]
MPWTNEETQAIHSPVHPSPSRLILQAGEVRHSLRHSHITRVPSVFFGGGTPSLARPNMVEKVLQAIQVSGHLGEEAEVSLEVNPTALETHTLEGFRAAGVNRVSIGVQSFDAATLSLLNRDHSAGEARRCVEAAQRLFPGRVSLDLMFGLPDQSVERWRREVEEAVGLCGNHLSLYQLTLERGTALWHQVKAGEVRLPGPDEMADLYEVAVQVLSEAGLHRYEVSNFAHHPQAESVHNKGYWQGQQYLGAGPGAHSRVVPRFPDNIQEPEDKSHINTTPQEVIREARVNAADPASWLHETQTKGNGTRKKECQTRLEVAAEYLASGLRTREGVTEGQWGVFMPQAPLAEVFGGELGWLEDASLVCLSPKGLRATEKGLGVLDAFLPHLYNILHQHLT